MNQVDPAIISALQPGAVEAVDLLSLPAYKVAVEKTYPRRAHGGQPPGARRLADREALGPIAFDGDPTTATVLLLKANPSYGDGATRDSHFEPRPDRPLSVAGLRATPGTRAYYQNEPS